MRMSSAVDYDEKAFNSRIPIQRYWQRKRFKYITEFSKGHIVLDLGCGSSRIIQKLQEEGRGIGLDFSYNKLHYLKNKVEGMYVCGNVQKLGFKDESVDCVIYSNVIEHINSPKDSIAEITRVLKEGGCLILATPDYGSKSWRLIEKVYDLIKLGNSYKKEHISPLTLAQIYKLIQGYVIKDVVKIFGSEVIIKCRKGG